MEKREKINFIWVRSGLLNGPKIEYPDVSENMAEYYGLELWRKSQNLHSKNDLFFLKYIMLLDYLKLTQDYRGDSLHQHVGWLLLDVEEQEIILERIFKDMGFTFEYIFRFWFDVLMKIIKKNPQRYPCLEDILASSALKL
jgi:hypothetical protein